MEKLGDEPLWDTCFSCQSAFRFLIFFDQLSSHKSVALLNAAVYGIRWAHQIAGLQSPTDHVFVKQIIEAGRRLYGKPSNPRKPITVDTLKLIVEKYVTRPYQIFEFVLFF